jgi:hypothetical protein
MDLHRDLHMAHSSRGTVGMEPSEDPGVLYFPVSLPKLALMSICTFGIYEIFWAWCCWHHIEVRDGRRLRLLWRSTYGTSIFFNFFLFWDISRTDGSSRGAALVSSLCIGLAYAGFWAWGVLYGDGAYWYMASLSFFVLLPVQAQINHANERHCPDHDPNNKFSVANLVAIFVGGLLFTLMLLGAWLPER